MADISKITLPSNDEYNIKDATARQNIAGKIDTAGTGLSKTGTTLNHSNSITAQTTQALYPIKIDGQGHISAYGNAVTIPTKVSDLTNDSGFISDYTEIDPTVPSWAKASTKPSYTASEVGAIATSAVGANSGVAPLNASGKIDSTYLPSYVDDVIEGYYYNSKFYTTSAHTTEITGETGKIFVDLSTNKTYRYGGSSFTEISQGSVVSVSRDLTSGTKIGTLTINGTGTDLYAPTPESFTVTGGASTIVSDNLTANRVLISNTNGKVAVSDVTSTELGYLDGVTSAIQTQINGKQAKITTSGILKGDGSGGVTAATEGMDYQAPLPSQSGNNGKFLTTNGSTISWANLPFNAFIAEQNVTTFAEIEAAIAAERPCFAHWEGYPQYLLPLNDYDPGEENEYPGYAVFVEASTAATGFFEMPAITRLICNSPNTWSEDFVYMPQTRYVWYGVCSTAASTQTKTATITGLSGNVEGITVTIKFENAQSYNGNPMLNINGMGARPLKYDPNTLAEKDAWVAGELLHLVYDGTAWIIIGKSRDSLPSQTGNSGKYLTTDGTSASWATISIPTVPTMDSTPTNGNSSNTVSSNGVYDMVMGRTKIYTGSCSTAAATAAKVVTLDDATGFNLTTGTKVAVTFSNANTTTGTTTLNVNGTGAKNVVFYSDDEAGGYYTAGAIYNQWGMKETLIFTYTGTSWCHTPSQYFTDLTYNLAAGKQTKITALGVLAGDGNGNIIGVTVDTTPSFGSSNLITSGAVYAAILGAIGGSY